jgi:hypothetical protein
MEQNYERNTPESVAKHPGPGTCHSVRNVPKSTPSMHATPRIAYNPELVHNPEGIGQMKHVQCRRIEISAWMRITFTKTRKIIGHKSCPKFL